MNSESSEDEVPIRQLDLLFHRVRGFRDSDHFREMLQFIRQFPSYAPFNAFLLHTQKPGCQYVASISEWERMGRSIKPGARPLVILWPFSPVQFVYEIGETEGDKPLPEDLVNPFKNQGRLKAGQFSMLVRNLSKYGISFHQVDQGTGSAGSISPAVRGKTPPGDDKVVKVDYHLVVNGNHSEETQFATICHELAHLFCGHFGNPDHRLWPTRGGLPLDVREFEAESVAWLVCARAGIENPSESYLENYLGANREIPPISFDAVLKATGMIEEMVRAPIRSKK